MALPTYIAAGTIAAAAAAAITPALPAGIEANDILLLFCETANQAVTIADAAGGTWTAAPLGGEVGQAGNRVTLFWSRYDGVQTAPTTNAPANHILGIIHAFRGCTTQGEPFLNYSEGVDAVSDTAGVITGHSTYVNNCLVVVAIATSLPDADSTTNFADWANTDLGSVTERSDNTTLAGNGGGLGVATGTKVVGGTYGNTTVTLANAAVKAFVTLGLSDTSGYVLLRTRLGRRSRASHRQKKQ